MSDKPDRDQQTEAPSAKKRRDAEQKGDVLQSRELGTALVMAAGVGWLVMAGPWAFGSLASAMRTGLTFGRGNLDSFDPFSRMVVLFGSVAMPLTALFGATMIAAIGSQAMLGSLGFRTGGFSPKASKLSPAAGLSRIFGVQGLIELGKSIAKVVLLGATGYWLLSAKLPTMMALGAADPRHAMGDLGTMFISVVAWLVGGLAVIGMIDAPIQIMRRTARLRMTKHEVKEEHKESEGSPEMKQQARQRRHEILSGSARRAVGEATVILTNPTHFAIALRYRPGVDAVPTVVARGRNETAQAIKALAKEASVPQLEYPQLTRAIYFTTRAGQPIAADLYLAVATVLAFVFNLDRAVAEGVVQPDVEVPAAKQFDEAGHRKT
ncbi:MAG: flagellar type III secretion system protein FlhB [Sphingomonadales bacterium]